MMTDSGTSGTYYKGLVPVSRMAVQEAWAVWRARDQAAHLSSAQDHYRFCDFLGAPVNMAYSINGSYYFLKPEAANRIQQLNGPHAQTIIKAWYAKHEQSSDDRIR